jgi:hypothetical protein
MLSRLGSSRVLKLLTPVTLPPGRLRLPTNPAARGSALNAATIGMVAVAVLAANAAGCPPAAASTVTGRLTSSVAIAGNRSYRPSAQRYSIATFRPSV